MSLSIPYYSVIHCECQVFLVICNEFVVDCGEKGLCEA